jgi:tetratricopeptide (TPR) repeat protein
VRFRFGTWRALCGRVTLCVCLLVGAGATQSASEEDAQRFAREGVNLLEQNQPAAAIEKLAAAWSIWSRLGSVQGEAAVIGKIGEAERARDNLQRALELHLRAGSLWYGLRIHDSAIWQFRLAVAIAAPASDLGGLCVALGRIGELELTLGDVVSARQDLNDAVMACGRTWDATNEARALSSLAELQIRRGQYDRASESLATASKVPTSDPDVLTSLVRNRGLLYAAQGRLEEAREQLDRARGLARDAGNLEAEGIILTALGRTYRELGNPEQSGQHYGFAIAALKSGDTSQNREFARGIRPLLAEAVNELGELHLVQGKLPLAREHFVEALFAIAIDADRNVVLRGDSDRRTAGLEASARLNLGTAVLRQGDAPAALRQLANALTIAEDLSAQALEARVLNQMGKALHALRRFDEADRSFQAALRLQVSIGDVIGEMATLTGAALLDSDRQDYASAIAKLQRGADLLEETRGSFEAAENRLGFLSAQVSATEMMTALLGRVAQMPTRPTFTLKEAGDDFASAAFHYAERTRARAWVEWVAERRETSDLPGDLGLEHEALVSARDSALRAYRDVAIDTRLAGDRYRGATNALSQFVMHLRAHPDPQVRAFAALRYPFPVRTSELRQVLQSNEVLIEYSVTAGAVLAWVIERDRTPQLHRPPLTAAALQDDVRAVRMALQNEYPLPEPTIERLFAALVATPLGTRATGKRLIVIPHDALSSLPFEILGRRLKNEFRYVADEHVISYYPSATLLVLARTGGGRPAVKSRPDKRWSHQLLALGDPVYGASTGFTRLEATADEVAALGRLMQRRGASPELKFGPEARESVLKELSRAGSLRDYRYLHIAAHGVVDPSASPLGQPALVLSQEPDGSRDDGFLSMQEVMGLRLSAELVVLSACQTGQGESVRGEGVVGLMRAFFLAGAQSAVVSLWRVADRSTATLMQYFYEELENPTGSCAAADKACALNTARKRLRATHAHPYFWAPFVFFGES